jgi:5-formyltetrahydrofolate cyclo-ligase
MVKYEWLRLNTDDKKVIRKELLLLRGGLTIEFRKKADNTIVRSLLDLPEFISASLIFCFVGIKNEIDTLPFIDVAIKLGKRICIPRIQEDGSMDAFEIKSEADLVKSVYGLLEPVSSCSVVGAEDISLVVTPCLACDLNGYRIGYGGGYYDKYMAGKDFCKVAICRERFVLERLPVDGNDVPVDIIISEKRVYRMTNI